ncbi:hypothetical protein chiPu_0021902 [Chiloscyllium punctatum]|uniref:Uncharacterized protein n=1 Tax=Chiloscyllium punctatum TaxID=137246 RepID=A0A401RET0_CHIPU|nr:hypothetical protein [Chiloscyllium punctatum]
MTSQKMAAPRKKYRQEGSGKRQEVTSARAGRRENSVISRSAVLHQRYEIIVIASGPDASEWIFDIVLLQWSRQDQEHSAPYGVKGSPAAVISR